MPTCWRALATLIVAVFTPFTVICEEVSLTPVTLIVSEGENASFTCSPFVEIAESVFNTIDPITNETGVVLNSDPRISIMDIPEMDPTMRVYTWLNASRADNGRGFFCHFSDQVSDISTLYVIYKITVVIDETDFTVDSGDDLYVPITIDGFPINPELTRDGVPVEIDGSRIQLGTDSLLIFATEPQDAGLYVLTLSNTINSVTVNFTVTVRFAPIFEPQPPIAIQPGNAFMIDCSASAFPALTGSITLTRDGDSVTLDQDNTYTVVSASTSDAGTYECSATNEIGSSTLTIEVEVGDVPGTVSDIEITTEIDKLVIEWKPAASNGANITHYEVVIESKEISFAGSVNGTSITLFRKDYDIPKEGAEVELSISVTAVNRIGRGEMVKRDETAKFDSLTSSSASRSLAANGLFVVLMVCSVLLKLV